MVCDKTFRSEKAWGNHERSNKHLKEISRYVASGNSIFLSSPRIWFRMKRQMAKENADLGLDQEEQEHTDEDVGSGDEAGSGDGDDTTRTTPDEIPDNQASTPFQARHSPLEPIPDITSLSLAPGPTHVSQPQDTEAPSSPIKDSSTRRDVEDSDEGSDDPKTGTIKSPPTPAASGSAQSELSKRDKRRAREAAKKVKENKRVDDENSVQVRALSQCLRSGLTVQIAMQRLFGNVPQSFEVVRPHQRHRSCSRVPPGEREKCQRQGQETRCHCSDVGRF